MTTKQEVMDMLKSGEISDEELREMLGGSTRLQGLADRCVLARIKASRGPTTAANKAERNALAAGKHAATDWLTVSNKLFTGDAVRPVTAAYHASRELLAVGKTHHDDGTPANETGVNFGLGKWDGTWTVVPRSRLADLELMFDRIKQQQERGKEDVRAQWDEIMANAEANLGDMFDPGLFPDAEQWLSKFSLELEVIAMPLFDMRISMDKNARGDLAMQVRRATTERIAKQMVGAWDRTAQVYRNSVAYVHAVLISDAATVKAMNNQSAIKRASERQSPIASSLLPNLREQGAMTLALAEAARDTTLVNFVSEVNAIIGDLEAEQLTKNPELRAGVAKSLARVLEFHGDSVVESSHKQAQEALDEVGVDAGDDLLDFA